MVFRFALDRFERPEIAIERSFWTRRTKVLIDGKEIEKDKKEHYYEIELPDGSIKKMKIKGSSFDGIPKISIDEKNILLGRELLWYEYLLAALPLLLLFVGGALGGLLGGLATVYNLRIMRSNLQLTFKLLCVIASTILTGVIYSILTIIIVALLY